MWADSDRLLSERRFGSGWRSGSGTGEISVPSTLSRELGLLDSFSICTNGNGTGRIAFGDKGPVTQQTTPFVSNSR